MQSVILKFVPPLTNNCDRINDIILDKRSRSESLLIPLDKWLEFAENIYNEIAFMLWFVNSNLPLASPFDFVDLPKLYHLDNNPDVVRRIDP